MTNIKVACVGTGYFSRFHYEAWTRIDAVRLIASVNRTIASAEATGLPAFDNLERMLETAKPDLVDIITPPPTHLDYIKASVDHGVRAIICQKPFCLSIDEALIAADLCEKAGIPLIVHENFRFQPWYRTMKRALDDGAVGEVHQLSFRLRTGDGQGPDAYLARQPYFQTMPRFLIHETGVHWIDTFRYLMGDPTSVYADLRKMNPVIAGEDAGYFIMAFDDGRRALFDANRHLDHDSDNCRLTFGEALLEGSEGCVSLHGDGAVHLREFGQRGGSALLEPREWPGFAGDCVHALQQHVIRGLLDGGPFENQARDYLRVLELEDAVYTSAERGVKVAT